MRVSDYALDLFRGWCVYVVMRGVLESYRASASETHGTTSDAARANPQPWDIREW